MRAISSHRDIKMRVLILSAALFACAAGAPSGVLAPIPALVPAVALPGINYGDLKGAFIDAKVQAEDQLRSIAEQQRLANEQAQENTQKVIESVDQIKERSLEAFWAGEEQKWQALDALKTAEAQIDGQIAGAAGYGKSLVISPVVSTVGVIPTPVIHPGIVAPIIKTFTTEQLLQINAQAAKTEEKKTEEQTKSAEVKPEENKDSVSVEAAGNTEAPASAQTTSSEGSTTLQNQQYLTPVAFSPLKFASPYVTSPLTFYQPGYNTISALPYPAHVLAPTVYKTW